MRRKEREVRAEFYAAGATIAANAMSMADLRLDDSMALRRLRRRAVIREASPGLFYFDEDVWHALHAMRVRMALLLVGTIVLFGLLIAYGSVSLK
ncbi:MAG: hypothetical protein Q7S20_08795 [Gemmatimonadaceae bacterium]|nr:hypothetical protein [Gemmatimonadaceae bacterium]